jgi:CYTH domain-containing protein
MMDDVPLEIERKLLLATPDDAALDALAAGAWSVSDIVQTYLVTDSWDAERVRRRAVHDSGGERVQLTHTCKRRVSTGVAEELEREIDESAYAHLVERADPHRRPIEKTRWVLPWGGRTLEVDGFRSPPGLWLLEIELPDAASLTDDLDLPPWLTVVAEVTDDPAYANVALARREAI